MNEFWKFFPQNVAKISTFLGGDIFYKRLNIQAQIFKKFHARRISKMVKNVPLTSKEQI